MGLAGSIPGSESARRMVVNRRDGRGTAALPAVLPSVSMLAAGEEPPRAPRGLQATGRAVWRLVWTEAGAWLAEADRPLIVRLAQLVDEIAAYRAALLEHGPVVSEPVVSPRGEVVGSKLAPNPAAKMLHDADVELNALTHALGLSPRARAQLGLTAVRTRRHLVAINRAQDDQA